jgi:hypothetical protein
VLEQLALKTPADFANKKEAASRKQVVGTPGNTIPIPPSATHRPPGPTRQTRRMPHGISTTCADERAGVASCCTSVRSHGQPESWSCCRRLSAAPVGSLPAYRSSSGSIPAPGKLASAGGFVRAVAQRIQRRSGREEVVGNLRHRLTIR